MCNKEMEKEFSYIEINELMNIADEQFRVPKEISKYQTAEPCPAHAYSRIIDSIAGDGEKPKITPLSDWEKNECAYMFLSQLFLSLGIVSMAYWYFKDESNIEIPFEYSSGKYLVEKLNGGSETAEFLSIFFLNLENIILEFEPVFRRFSLDELNRKTGNYYILIGGENVDKIYLYDDTRINSILEALCCAIRLRFKRRYYPNQPAAEFILGVVQERRYQGYPKNYALRVGPELLISAYSISPGTVSTGLCISNHYDELGEVLIREEQIAKINKLRMESRENANPLEEIFRTLFKYYRDFIKADEIERMGSDSVFFFRQPNRFLETYKQSDVDFDQALKISRPHCTELDILDDCRNAARTLDGYAGHLEYIHKNFDYPSYYFAVLSLIYVMDNTFTVTPAEPFSCYSITTLSNLALILYEGRMIDFTGRPYTDTILQRLRPLTEYLTGEYEKVYSDVINFLYRNCRYKIDNFVLTLPEYVDYMKIFSEETTAPARLDGGKLYYHLMLSMCHPAGISFDDLAELLYNHYMRIINELAARIFGKQQEEHETVYSITKKAGRILHEEVRRQFNVLTELN